MTDASWKQFERRIATLFGGKRRGAYTGTNGNGKTDVIAPGWAIEVKLYGRPSYQVMLDACRQAEKNRENPDDIPVAIVKRKGDHDQNALVCMRLDEFQQFFVNVSTEDE